MKHFLTSIIIINSIVINCLRASLSAAYDCEFYNKGMTNSTSHTHGHTQTHMHLHKVGSINDVNNTQK